MAHRHDFAYAGEDPQHFGLEAALTYYWDVATLSWIKGTQASGGGGGGALTDAELRASAVAVTGPLTDAQLRATAVPVSLAAETTKVIGTVNQGTTPWTVTGGGGGTEYVVNAVVPADPTGTTVVMERDDQLTALSEVEGDWTNARANNKGALWVAMADSAGDPITSFGGGTQYVEDVAAAADPTGTALVMVRADSLSAVTTTDGDNIAARSTNKGEQYVKHVDSIPVTDNGSSLTVDGTVAVSSLPALVAGAANIGDVDVLTVPAPLSTTGGGTEATALRVTLANDSTGLVSVDDNGGSLTVDGPLTDAQLRASAVPISAAALPLPSGAATAALQTQPGVDIGDVTVNNGAAGAAVNIQDGGNIITVDGTVAVSVLPALVAGGANIGDVDVLTVPAPLSTAGGGTEATALRVTLANDSTGLVSVDDNAGSLTVDNPILSVVGGGTEAAAQRVTIANDSTGVLSVDDNGGSLTVDGTSVNPGTGQGKTLAFAAIAQGAAGTTALVGADVTRKVKVVSYVAVLSAAGTAKFTDGTADLTGAMDIAANGGVSAMSQPASHILETAAINRPLNIVTTGGAARGHVSYFLEA